MTRAPKLKAPPGACDSHLHIYGESGRYPWVPVKNRPFPNRRLEHDLAVRDWLGLARTVVVQPTHYATDNRSLVDIVAALGDTGRGIAVVDPSIADGELAPFVNVYLDGEDIRTLDGLDTPVSEGGSIILLPAMAGGS